MSCLDPVPKKGMESHWQLSRQDLCSHLSYQDLLLTLISGLIIAHGAQEVKI